MRRSIATLTASAALLAGVGLTSLTTEGTATAASAGWCDGVTRVRASSETYKILPYDTDSGSRDCTLARGAAGTAVTALQTALVWCNEQDHLDVDGMFGPNTEAALMAAQRLRGTDDDGIYGPNTRRALSWPVYRSATGRILGCP